MAEAYEDENLHACRQINASEHENKQQTNEKCCNAICMYYARKKTAINISQAQKSA